MEGEEAYSDFIKATGFGSPSTLAPPEQSPNPIGTPNTLAVSPSVRQAEASKFQGTYQRASTSSNPTRVVPNAVSSSPSDIPGVVSSQQYRGQNHLGTPLRTAPLGAVDARTGPRSGTAQETWQAVAVGGGQDSPTLKMAASSRLAEKATAAPMVDNQKIYIFGAIMTLGFVVSILKWNGTNKNKPRSGYWAPTAAIFGFGLVACVYYYKNPRENMTGRKPIGANNFPVVPRQADQPDVNPYPKPSDPQNTTSQRDMIVGVQGSDIEGPRAKYGYQRGKVTAEDRQRLQEDELMRSAKYHNMDEGTFNEYMARLDGEAPNQFVQSHPYMPFSAHWEERDQIDDMSKRHGIGTGPGPANRKYKYRDPRIQQAGARTMHLKDPPPGSVHALGNKTHPWLERDESGLEPPVLLGAEVVNHEKLTAQDTQSFTKSRLMESKELEIPYGEMDKDFMKVEEIKRQSKTSFPVRPDYTPDGNVSPPRTLDLKAQHEQRQSQIPPMTHQQDPPQLISHERESMMRNPMPNELPQQYRDDPVMEDHASDVQKLNVQEMNHRKPSPVYGEDQQSFAGLHSNYADDDGSGGGSFEAAFAPKETPSESEIAKAQEDVRRA